MIRIPSGLQGRVMNRKVVLTVMSPVLFFLVSLGMRNPDLKGNPRPKPRPRAVIENVEKTPKEICYKHLDVIHPCQTVSIDLPKPVFNSFDLHSDTVIVQVVAFIPSRASPPQFS